MFCPPTAPNLAGKDVAHGARFLPACAQRRPVPTRTKDTIPSRDRPRPPPSAPFPHRHLPAPPRLPPWEVLQRRPRSRQDKAARRGTKRKAFTLAAIHRHSRCRTAASLDRPFAAGARSVPGESPLCGTLRPFPSSKQQTFAVAASPTCRAGSRLTAAQHCIRSILRKRSVAALSLTADKSANRSP